MSIMKKCVICQEEKDTAHFHKKQHGKYGVSSRCKPCDYEYGKKYRKSAQARFYIKHKERINAQSREKYAANPDKHIEMVQKSRAKHYDKYIAKSRQYEKENKKARLEKRRAYTKHNPEKIALQNIKRNNQLKQCTPDWANKSMLRKIYKLRNRLNNLAGYIKYHVDHVIPINAKLASGLHVPENLQITLGSINMSKRNTYEVTL